MKHSYYLTFSLAALLFTGCGTPTKVDKGPIRATTFSFVDGGAKPSPGVDSREQVHLAIQESITRNLAERGLSRVPSGGDVTVAYLVIIGDNISTESISTYFGHGREVGALQDAAHNAYTSSENPNYFRAGTLLIDVIDGKTYELLKRSYVVRPLLKDPTAEVRGEKIQEAVDAALKDLRVGR